MTQFKLTGKIALITGGASGIGLATANAFLSADVQGLGIIDISQASLDQAYQAIPTEYHSRLLMLQADCTDETQTIAYHSKIVEKFGRIDVAVYSAGILQHRTSVIDTLMETYDNIFKINCRGVFLGLKTAAKAMKEGGVKGSIILVGSQLGLDGAPDIAVYSASKFAIRGFASCAAAELGPFGIRVNTIAPGPILTPMTVMYPEINKVLGQQCMLRRIGQPEEIANAMLFLASDASSFVTGSTQKVDGGHSKWV